MPKKIEPIELTEAQTFAFMAAIMGGVTWGLAPDANGWVHGEDYCAGDRQIRDEIRWLVEMQVLQGDMTDPSVPLSGPYPFKLGKRPTKG